MGPKIAAAAAGIGLHTLADVVEHFPHGYRDRSERATVAELKLGASATLEVEVRSAALKRIPRRRLSVVEAVVTDGTGTLTASWFNQAWLAEKLIPGTRLAISGKLDRRGFRVSEYEVLSAVSGDAGLPDPVRGPARPPPGIHATGIVAVHPRTEGLREQRIREWAWAALVHARSLPEPLPAPVRRTRGLIGAADARVAAHFPRDSDDITAARRRLAYEELFLHQLALAVRRTEREQERPGLRLEAPGALTADWIASLPFTPTADQRRACGEVDSDLGGGRAMQRLLMGEVGSGKTVVALYAMLRAIESGAQAALMAPTETLAEQHFATLDSLLAGTPLPAALLTGSTSVARKRETLERLATGELGLIVGTHALIEPAVEFARLGVVVIDEQHRFGVTQRRLLDSKGPGELAPHALHMTATPIPRTLSLTAFGDLDVSTLRELPAGRQPIRTWVVGEDRRPGAYGFIRKQVEAGRQVYIVCPLVSESEGDQGKAVEAEAERLRVGELAGLELVVMHGQMPSARKSEAMERFASGDADVLVATSVIEVGVDVPNAAVMVIEAADRYGLSQLHQLRGRIGRGSHASHCILFPSAGESLAASASARLEAIKGESDGFRLAEVDLALRGEGEVLGTRQSGLPRFRVASLPEDAELLGLARDDAFAVLEACDGLDDPLLGPSMIAVRERFGDERVSQIAA